MGRLIIRTTKVEGDWTAHKEKEITFPVSSEPEKDFDQDRREVVFRNKDGEEITRITLDYLSGFWYDPRD